MKNYLYFYLILLLLGTGCSKSEDDVFATDVDINWYEVPNLPGEFNEIRYEIYSESGITVIVEDTLGSTEIGVDAFGNPIVHTEVFDVGYKVTGDNAIDFQIVESVDTTAMIKAMQVIKKHVLPYFPENMSCKPHVIFLLDSIYYVQPHFNSNVGDQILYSTCMGGVPIGHIDRLKNDDIDSEQWLYWAAKILSIKTGEWIQERCVNDFQQFIEKTPKYGWNNSQSYYNYDDVAGKIDCKDAALLKWGQYYHNVEYQPEIWREKGPTQLEDLQEYITYIYLYRGRETEFEERYKDYPLIIEKFRLVEKMTDEYFVANSINF